MNALLLRRYNILPTTDILVAVTTGTAGDRLAWVCKWRIRGRTVGSRAQFAPHTIPRTPIERLRAEARALPPCVLGSNRAGDYGQC